MGLLDEAHLHAVETQESPCEVPHPEGARIDRRSGQTRTGQSFQQATCAGTHRIEMSFVSRAKPLLKSPRDSLILRGIWSVSSTAVNGPGAAILVRTL